MRALVCESVSSSSWLHASQIANINDIAQIHRQLQITISRDVVVVTSLFLFHVSDVISCICTLYIAVHVYKLFIFNFSIIFIKKINKYI